MSNKSPFDFYISVYATIIKVVSVQGKLSWRIYYKKFDSFSRGLHTERYLHIMFEIC